MGIWRIASCRVQRNSLGSYSPLQNNIAKCYLLMKSELVFVRNLIAFLTFQGSYAVTMKCSSGINNTILHLHHISHPDHLYKFMCSTSHSAAKSSSSFYKMLENLEPCSDTEKGNEWPASRTGNWERWEGYTGRQVDSTWVTSGLWCLWDTERDHNR